MSDWYTLTRPVGDLLNKWADRNDLITFLGPERGGSTAFCDLLRGEIEANTDTLFAGYEEREVTTVGIENFRKFPVAIGALYHEAMHARHSPRADQSRLLSGLRDREVSVYTMMEEPRIEYRGIQHDAKMQRYLRSSGLRIALKDALNRDEIKNMTAATDMLPLSLGRAVAGSVKDRDVSKLRGLFVDHYDEATVTAAEDLMRQFIRTDDEDDKNQVRIVKEWIRLFPQDEEQEPEELTEEQMQAILDALGDGAASAGAGAMDDLDQDARDEKRAARDRQRQEKAERKSAAEKEGKKDTKPSDMRESYYGSRGSSGSVPFSERKPTSEERAAAVRLSTILAQVEYTEKIRTHVASEVPPGKPKMRTVIANRGARAAGSRSKPQPEWEALRRDTVDTPTLRVGVIVDVSGSMSDAMLPMAVTSFVLKTALERIHAKTVTTYMGGVAYAPKVPKDTVQIWEAVAGWENFTDAKALMDHELNLTLDEDGARLAVIVSDGQYREGQTRSAEEWITLLKSQGATVLWAGYGSHYGAQAICRKAGADFVAMSGRETPAEVATIIGNAAVNALRAKK